MKNKSLIIFFYFFKVSNLGIAQCLGAWKTYPPAAPGEAQPPPDQFEIGSYPSRLGDLLRFVAEIEGYSLLTQPLEGVIPFDVIGDDLNKIEAWYASDIVEGELVRTYRELIFNRKNNDLNIKKIWEKTQQENQSASLYREQDQTQFQKAIEGYGHYLKQSWFRKTLSLLREYGPNFWEIIKEDAIDIGKGILQLLSLPLVLLKGVFYDLPRTLHKARQDPQYRQALGQRIRNSFAEVKNSIVSFFTSIKDM